jgi:rod shape-determining protein MreD
MDSLTLRFSGAILLSIFIALILSIVHLPEALQAWRPEWVALAIIHWGMLFPKKNHYLMVWIAGLLLDALLGSTIGQHALGFVIVLFITIRMTERITPNTLIQHLFLNFIALGTYLLVNLWILGISDEKPHDWSYWFPLFSSLLFWPLVHSLLNRLHIVNRSI